MAEALLDQPVRRLAELLRTGATTPPQLLEALLARIEATEPSVKAYSHLRAEAALAEAEAAAAEIAARGQRGPLHGIPVAIKDLIETAGVPTTYGSPLYAGNVPDADATVVTRLREAGAIVIGKTNTHEFALGASTPPTRNPFDLERIPGGSSGGSAAAVAAGSALISLGSDTGGSIRIPASFCGVVGLKPTYGLVSRVGVFPESWSLDHVGPITRRVEDAAVLLGAVAGHDPRDPASHAGGPTEFLANLDAGVAGLRIGVPVNHFYDDLDREVEAATRAALAHLEAEGAELREIVFPGPEELLAAHTAIDLAEIATNHRRVFAEHRDSYLPETRPFVELGFLVGVTTYIDALRARPGLLRGVLEAMDGVDVLVVPSQPIVAPPVGAGVAVVNGADEDLIGAVCRLLAQFNLTGQPALSLCCGYAASGLPIGLQIVGRPFADALVLRVAQAYQATTPWLEQLPGRLRV